MKNSDLTIVLTLRGRHLHTLRWLWHANRIGLPFHIIIADGEVHPTIDRLLSDPATFPNLSFEYHRHNDLSFTDFYRKCSETLRRVRTDFAMMTDNDDFPLVTGILKSIGLLKERADFVCAGGRIPEFALSPRPELPGPVIGRMIGQRFGYKQPARDISSDSATDRVMEEIDRYQVIYYHVYRTAVLRAIFEEAEKHDFSDLTVHEQFCALRTVTMGKVGSDPAIVCYLRQTGTSTVSTYWTDWVQHLLRSTLPQDYREMATAVADAAAKSGGNESTALKERILDANAGKIRHMLGHTMMRHRFPGLFKLKQSLLPLRKLTIVPAWFREYRESRNFWRDVAEHCGEPALLAVYRMEFENIKTTLQGDEFLSFIASYAPDLSAAPQP